MIKQVLLVLVTLMLFSEITAQKIDHLISFRDIDSQSYFRFHYDNDYFAATDENYTQGYYFEVFSSVFNRNPINKILLKPEGFELKYGLGVEHIGFTPNNYQFLDIQFGDRPFASAIMLKSSVLAKNKDKKLRLHSSLNIGLIGPGAFGEEMQVGIHKATGNKTPRGWQHQIKNDIVLNYNVGIEKQLLYLHDFISIQAQSNLNVGTLFTNISVGSNMIFGIFNDSFSSSKQKKKFQIYTYTQPVFSIIGYDATLQGGVINRKSPYTISPSAIERFTFQFNYGVVIQTKRLYFEYTRSSISKEFNTGSIAKWGGFRIGFTF